MNTWLSDIIIFYVLLNSVCVWERERDGEREGERGGEGEGEGAQTSKFRNEKKIVIDTEEIQ